MRATDPKLTNKDIAERLGIGEATLNVMITKATKEGWLVFEDPMKRLEHQIIPQVTENLYQFAKEGDKQVSIEVFKGAMVPAFKEAKGIQEAPSTILAIKIEPTGGSGEVPVFSGQIVGTEKVLEE
jgi:predicted transcriptional regulator